LKRFIPLLFASLITRLINSAIIHQVKRNAITQTRWREIMTRRRIVLHLLSWNRYFYISDFRLSIMASSFQKFFETWRGSGPITEFEPERILYGRSLKQMRPAIELNDIIYHEFVTSINLRYISFPIIFFYEKS